MSGETAWASSEARLWCDAVLFEAYLNNPRDVPPTELLTDIHLPLA